MKKKTLGLKLYVDDIRNPDDFVGPGWHWAKTVTEAIRILDEQDVDIVSLDHDIAHSIPITGSTIAQPFACTETFEPVARFIRCLVLGALDWDDGHSYPHTVYLHSANPIGIEKMKAILAPVNKMIHVVEAVKYV